MTDKLLPCPFCGGTPILELFNDGVFDYARILCCRVMFDWCEDKTGEQAIAAWNRRADNLPVVCGEWIQKHHIISLDNMTLTGTYPTCNLCGYAWLGVAKNTNFCPNCGAKMESEDNT